MHDFHRARRQYLDSEQIPAPTAGNMRVGLLWPGSYESGMASLGFAELYRRLNLPGVSTCERYFGALGTLTPEGGPCLSLESGRPLGDCDLVAVSLGCERELGDLVGLLRGSGIEPLSADRGGRPGVVAGGAATRSNPWLLKPVADVVICGDGEDALEALAAMLGAGRGDREALLEYLGGAPGAVSDRGGDGLPAVSRPDLPLVSSVVAPRAAFGDMRLVELVRGCPRACGFCVCCRHLTPFRQAPRDLALERLAQSSGRLGLLGAGVADWPHLAEALELLASRGREASVSSLRADRLDERLLLALKGCGTRSLTVALDGPSHRLRAMVGKELGEAAFKDGLALAAKLGLGVAKVYVMVGLPGETEEDLRELADFLLELATFSSLTVAVSPFVPKRNTALQEAPFGPVPLLTSRIKLLSHLLKGRCRLSQVSPREAALEHALTWVSPEAVADLVPHLRQGMSAADWKALLRFDRSGPLH